MTEDKKEVLLRIDGLCQYFESGGRVNKAVDNVSFEVYRGEVFGLVGESGCGKTTTGRSVVKIYDITSGSIYFKGQRIAAGIQGYKDDVKNARERIAREIKEIRQKNPHGKNRLIADKKNELERIVAESKEKIARAIHDNRYCDRDYAVREIARIEERYRSDRERAVDSTELEELKTRYISDVRAAKRMRLTKGIQMIFQDPIASLNPRMTVGEIISEGLVVSGESDREYIEKRVYEMLELVGLVREHAGRYPHEFSGGQRQRIGIARAVIMNPEMIIADEPISALDVSVQAQVINLMNELRAELGLTVLFIAHDLSVVKYFSDRIGVMYFGKIVELAETEELFSNPLHPYTRSLLSAIPQPDPFFEKRRKRIPYTAEEEHDYSVDKPSLREIRRGHFVYCNDAEEKKYKGEEET